ncbi:MAG: hypothetical protein PHQ96_08495 [Candidatus Omnitrophica bacterium]|nr:hypothetical protein [Candidatus Omnitrophota bacterium]
MKRLQRFKLIVLVFLIISASDAGVFAHTLPMNLTPSQTELIEQKQELQEGFVIDKYKFRSLSSKETIISFYRQMFNNQGFGEVEPTPPLKNAQRLTYFFTKENQMILVSFLSHLDEGVTNYHVHVHEAGPTSK